MQRLPDELIAKIAMSLDYSMIIDFCTICKLFYRAICRNEYLWMNVFKRDFGEYHHPVESWKNLYRDTGNIVAENNQILSKLPFKFRQIRAEESGVSVVNLEGHLLNVTKSRIKYISQEPVRQMSDSRNYLLESGKIIYDGRIGKYGKFITNFGKTVGYIDLNDNVNIFSHNLEGVAGINQHIPFHNRIDKFKVKYLSCTDNHALAIDLKDRVWRWGDNIYSRVVIPDIRAKLVRCEYHHDIIIDLDDNLWIKGVTVFSNYSDEEFVKIPGIKAKDAVVYTSKVFSVVLDKVYIVDLEDNLTIYSRDKIESVAGKVLQLSVWARNYSILTLGYTPNINGIFIISQRRLQEKIRHGEILERRPTRDYDHLKKSPNSNMIIIRDIYDRFCLCEVDDSPR